MNKLSKKNFKVIFAALVFMSASSYIIASSTSQFTQTILAGSLVTDIVNAAFATVENPSFGLSNATASLDCQTTTGTFGSATQQIAVVNPDAARGGWTLSLAAAAATTVWNSPDQEAAGKVATFDFNDPTTSGCSDNGTDEADTVGGQMTVNPSAGTLATGRCIPGTCNTTGITKGSSDSYVQGTKDAITILSATAESSDVGDWVLTGVGISQTIPGSQPAAHDYAIPLVLTVTAI